VPAGDVSVQLVVHGKVRLCSCGTPSQHPAPSCACLPCLAQIKKLAEQYEPFVQFWTTAHAFKARHGWRLLAAHLRLRCKQQWAPGGRHPSN
jgi:hypothetical protein